MRIIIYILCFYSMSVCASNPFWIGYIENFYLKRKSKEEVILHIHLKEYTSEGTFEEFKESDIIFLNSENNGQKWTLTFDNIQAGKFKKYSKSLNISFIKTISIKHDPGGFSTPERLQTQGGTNIHTAKLSIVGEIPLHMYLQKINKDDTSNINLEYVITTKLPPAREASQKNGNYVELVVEDFRKEKSFGQLLGDLHKRNISPKMRWYLKQLKSYHPGTFVNLIYRVKYAEIGSLINQVRPLLSGLGQINAVNETARIVIRDRSEHVLEALQILLALDIPTPQVIIDVQIIERNIEEGLSFTREFNFLWRKNGKLHNFSLDNRSRHKQKGENFSGVYSNLSKGVLREFKANINAEVKRGKARIKASTRVMCKNRQRARFHSGNKIPTYQLRQIDSDTNRFKNNFTSNSDSNNSTRTATVDSNNATTQTSTDQSNINRNTQVSKQSNDTLRTRHELQFIETGVRLEVRPDIKNSSLVELQLKPSYSEITSMATDSNIPVLSDRSLDTNVTVRHGDTILVGGFLYEREIQMIKGVPLLMDIPLLGRLFSSEYSKRQQTEIIFVLTIGIEYPR